MKEISRGNKIIQKPQFLATSTVEPPVNDSEKSEKFPIGIVFVIGALVLVLGLGSIYLRKKRWFLIDDEDLQKEKKQSTVQYTGTIQYTGIFKAHSSF